jgi:hypothetical protein
MAIDIKVGDLASRAIRQKVTPGGIRRFASAQYTAVQSQNGGVIGFLVDVGKRFFGFLFTVITGIVAWSLTTLWQWLVSTVSFLWNFDWNKSDSALDAELTSAINAFGSTLGGAVGNALGWIVGGALGGTIAFCLNESLMIHILNDVGEEALEEISSQAVNVIRAGSRILSKAFFNWAYKKARAFVTGRSDDIYQSDAELDAQVAAGTLTKELADKNKKGRDSLQKSRERKPWSFALQWENFVESIPNEFLKNFIEEAFEEFFDAFIEVGYVMTASADAWYANNRQSQRAERTVTQAGQIVQVQLDRSQTTGNTQS